MLLTDPNRVQVAEDVAPADALSAMQQRLVRTGMWNKTILVLSNLLLSKDLLWRRCATGDYMF